MSGTIPLSMTQQMDQYGDPLDGGRLYFYVAGTVSTPQNAYKDSGLTLVHPNPITLDATGRVPQLFLADGLIKIRLTDAAGVVQLVADNIQVIGASSGGGGGGAIDATTIAQTGDLKKRYDTGVHTGWARCNGKTIGSATSGASELAHADAQQLFEHLWNVDPNLAVSGGRGANALADWTANRQLALPDGRGAVFAGMDDMGNTAANYLTVAGGFGANATVLGALGGWENVTLTTLQTPLRSHQHTGHSTATGPDSPNHKHPFARNTGVVNVQAGGSYNVPNASTEENQNTGNPDLPHSHPFSFTTDPESSLSATPHSSVQRTMVATIYIKL